MPTYDYRCTACKHEFEQFQSMKDPALRKCPRCGKAALERLIGTGAAVIFKGSGFYQTDYRSEAYKKAEAADRAQPDAAPKSEPKADANAKPVAAASSETKPAGPPHATSAPQPRIEPGAAGARKDQTHGTKSQVRVAGKNTPGAAKARASPSKGQARKPSK